MNEARLFRLLEATWPPAAAERVGPWVIRAGQGGGKRVSAANAEGTWKDEDIPAAERAMAALGQPALFMIRPQDVLLDQALQARGYRIVDPVVAHAAPVADLAEPAPSPMAAFAHWPPLAICAELWAEAGIGPGRLAVMDRARGPKAAILARTGDKPVGTAFVACDHDCAMLHALEVRQTARRQGSAHNIMRAAARWAQNHGAETLAVVVTVANTPARALYASLGMAPVGQYHYRQGAQAPMNAKG